MVRVAEQSTGLVWNVQCMLEKKRKKLAPLQHKFPGVSSHTFIMGTWNNITHFHISPELTCVQLDMRLETLFHVLSSNIMTK